MVTLDAQRWLRIEVNCMLKVFQTNKDFCSMLLNSNIIVLHWCFLGKSITIQMWSEMSLKVVFKKSLSITSFFTFAVQRSLHKKIKNSYTAYV